MCVLSSTAWLLAEGTDHFARLLDLAWIEPGGGLVEQQHLGRAEQRLGQARARCR